MLCVSNGQNWMMCVWSSKQIFRTLRNTSNGAAMPSHVFEANSCVKLLNEHQQILSAIINRILLSVSIRPTAYNYVLRYNHIGSTVLKGERRTETKTKTQIQNKKTHRQTLIHMMEKCRLMLK